MWSNLSMSREFRDRPIFLQIIKQFVVSCLRFYERKRIYPFCFFFMPSRGTALRPKMNSSSDLRKCKYSKYCNFVSLDFYLSKIAVDFRYT